MSDASDGTELIRRQTGVDTYVAIACAAGVKVEINGANRGTFRDLESAVLACPRLICCKPEDVFTVSDEEQLRAALRLDPALDTLDDDQFAISVNNADWDLSLDTDFSYERQDLVSAGDGGLVGAALIQFGPWLENYVPETPDQTGLWKAGDIDPREEARKWLPTCWFVQDWPDEAADHLEVDSAFLGSDDVDEIVAIFDRLLVNGGDLTLNGETVFVKTAEGGASAS